LPGTDSTNSKVELAAGSDSARSKKSTLTSMSGLLTGASFESSSPMMKRLLPTVSSELTKTG